jgi:urease accessory protein
MQGPTNSAKKMPVAATVTRRFGEAAGRITLDEQSRHRRRLALRSDNGIDFLLDLKHARLLHHGDGLMLDDGRIIEVAAAPEPLYEIRGKDARHLLALAWQIGNRHLAAQIEGDRLMIRPDRVIREMLEGLGAQITQIEAPFDPESGAYGDNHHGNAHGHGHEHQHD